MSSGISRLPQWLRRPNSLYQVPWKRCQGEQLRSPWHSEKIIARIFLYLLILVCIIFRKKNYNLNSDPFKSILIIWFTHRISIEQNFDVENLCQNFSVRKSSSFFYRAQHSGGGHIKRCENNPKFHCPFLHFCIMSFSSLKGGKHLL